MKFLMPILSAIAYFLLFLFIIPMLLEIIGLRVTSRLFEVLMVLIPLIISILVFMNSLKHEKTSKSSKFKIASPIKYLVAIMAMIPFSIIFFPYFAIMGIGMGYLAFIAFLIFAGLAFLVVIKLLSTPKQEKEQKEVYENNTYEHQKNIEHKENSGKLKKIIVAIILVLTISALWGRDIIHFFDMGGSYNFENEISGDHISFKRPKGIRIEPYSFINDNGQIHLMLSDIRPGMFDNLLCFNAYTDLIKIEVHGDNRYSKSTMNLENYMERRSLNEDHYIGTVKFGENYFEHFNKFGPKYVAFYENRILEIGYSPNGCLWRKYDFDEEFETVMSSLDFQPSDISLSYKFYGHFIDDIEEAFDRGLITNTDECSQIHNNEIHGGVPVSRLCNELFEQKEVKKIYQNQLSFNMDTYSFCESEYEIQIKSFDRINDLAQLYSDLANIEESKLFCLEFETILSGSKIGISIDNYYYEQDDEAFVKRVRFYKLFDQDAALSPFEGFSTKLDLMEGVISYVSENYHKKEVQGMGYSMQHFTLGSF